MRRTLILAILATLVVVPAASAHVTVTPTRVTPGSDVLLTFVVPNEDARSTIGGILLRPPRGFDWEGAQGPPGWRLERVGRELAWTANTRTGQPVAPSQLAVLRLSGTAPRRAGALTFMVAEILRDGREPRYRPRVVVAAAPAAPRAPRRDHRLALAALWVAVAAGVVAIGTFFLVLALWLRGGEASLPEGKRRSVVPSRE